MDYKQIQADSGEHAEHRERENRIWAVMEGRSVQRTRCIGYGYKETIVG